MKDLIETAHNLLTESTSDLANLKKLVKQMQNLDKAIFKAKPKPNPTVDKLLKKTNRQFLEVLEPEAFNRIFEMSAAKGKQFQELDRRQAYEYIVAMNVWRVNSHLTDIYDENSNLSPLRSTIADLNDSIQKAEQLLKSYI